LWLSGQLVALGVVKVVMGWPMVLGVIWLSWQVLEPSYAARRGEREALTREDQASAVPTEPVT